MATASHIDGTRFAALAGVLRREAESGPTDETKAVRVCHGIYSVRGQPGRYVVRIRVPAGMLTADQLETVATLTAAAGWKEGAHLTTRQGIEIAGVPAERVVDFLQRLEEAGLTTTRTGGNVVRGVVCCPLAGVADGEFFDVTPFALAVDQYFREHPDFQRMPRKIKIAFEGCTHDHVRTLVADIGVRAIRRDGQKGFRMVVGGGLGASPKAAQVLEEFVPVEHLPVTLEAVIRVFDRHGDRTNRAHARLKWLLDDWGIEHLRNEIVAERTRLLARSAPPLILPPVIEGRGNPRVTTAILSGPAAYEAWRQSNVRPQRQRGLATVYVRCPQGDLQPAQLLRVAEAARQFAGGIRTSIDQNLVLRWVPETALPALHEFLSPAGLAGYCAEQLLDVTRCVGATACLSAITNPKPAAEKIVAAIEKNLARDPTLQGLRIRVSGCPNSCSHHHAADIGLYGVSRQIHGRPVPHYVLLLGGASSAEAFGARVTEIPALRVAEAVEQTLEFYQTERASGENFTAFVNRIGLARVRQRLEPLTRAGEPETEPALYRDLGAERQFKVEAQRGECAA
jgi:sulfite reductase beta subunit-like hemoprotein